MALDKEACTKLLERYGRAIGEIPEAEELYNNALLGLEELGLTAAEVEEIRINAIADPAERQLAERLWIQQPPMEGESSLAHLARVEGEDFAIILRVIAALL